MLFSKHFSESDDNLQLFYANDPSDILRFRAGYYAGLEFVKWLADKHRNEQDILKIPRSDIE